ncbi:iron/zinc purple acid phosphatase-like protein-like protein [Aphelenchoides avenae]|nr:iron/zinc purple acid phosphatase-like protein-like protein [Aphelenchus avenae]
MAVTWLTMAPLTSPPAIEYGLQPTDLQFTAAGTQTDFVYNATHRYIHRAVLRGLTPNTTYFYQVGTATQGWSHVYHFRTLPAGNDFSFRVCIFGDLGVKNGMALPYLQKAAQRGDFDLVLHIGDFAYDLHSHNGDRGDKFMRQIEPIAAYVPYMVIAGNHEEDGKNFSHYRNRFTMPSEFGDNQFYRPLIANGNKTMDHRLPASSILLLEQGDSGMHCIRTGYEEFPGLEDAYLANGVDVVFCGHEHAYERFWPVSRRRVYNQTSNPYHNAPAPVYFVTGAAGCHGGITHLEKPANPASAHRNRDYGYSVLHVMNSTHLYVEQISAEKKQKVVDSVWITKDLDHAPTDKLAAVSPHVSFPDATM